MKDRRVGQEQGYSFLENLPRNKIFLENLSFYGNTVFSWK
jgi:hypothetical protein